MTGQRARAYGRVMNMLRQLGPAKLLPSEQSRIRHAADTLLFSVDPAGDLAAQVACLDISSLGDHLAASGRWHPEHADRLVDDVVGCGPASANALSFEIAA
jgi:hypothetical protein